MSTIDNENAKVLRKALDVHCGLSYRDSVAPITNIEAIDYGYGGIGDYLYDSNLTESLTHRWRLINPVTDLNNENTEDSGFRLEDYRRGNYMHLASRTGHIASANYGKYGYRCKVLGPNTTSGVVGELRITSSGYLSILTINTAQGEGEFLIEGHDYEETVPIKRKTIVKIPNYVSQITIKIYATNENLEIHQDRIIIDSIISGVDFEFSNDDLISCVLDLRADLSLTPSFPVSGIEINAYYPDDITEVVACITDSTPIWYYAGYDDSSDYCPVRNFYVSETLTYKNKVLTIKGEDISNKLADYNIVPTAWSTREGNGAKKLYEQMISNITTKCGITLRNQEATPSGSDTGDTYWIINKGCSVREWLADVMNLSPDRGEFYPRYVDAGIPSLAWSFRGRPSLTLDYGDIADYQINVDRTLARLTTDDERGLNSSATRNPNIIDLETFDVTGGQNYDFSDGDYYVDWGVTNGTFSNYPTKKNAETATFKATSNGKSYLTGYKIEVGGGSQSYYPYGVQRAGMSVPYTPLAYGRIYNGSTTAYPNYERLFTRSPITGSFTFRGDVRLQPRDIIDIRFDEHNTMRCTIETIKIMHENGGTKSEITFRKGGDS